MSEQMQVGELVFQLHRKAIKNLHINVLPPDGFVRVSAPQAMTETAIRTAVISRLPWIRRQQQAFAAQPRQPEREMVSGESHFLWGRKYRLDVVEQMGRHQVRLQSNNRLQLLVQPGTRLENRQELLRRFYRDELKQQLADLLEFFTAMKGAIKVFYWVGKLAKPAGAIVGFGAACVTAWSAWRGLR